jgi:hypothetical protein
MEKKQQNWKKKEGNFGGKKRTKTKRESWKKNKTMQTKKKRRKKHCGLLL